MSDTEKNKGSDPQENDEPQDAEEVDEEESATTPPEPSPWQEKAQRAQQLWDAGNNAELKKLLGELEKAPEDETEALEIARVLRRRLKPDPVAIGLWLLTFGIFCYLTYIYVLS